MTSDEKRALKRRIREQTVAAGRAALPLSNESAQSLFDALDEIFADQDCDHSLRITTGILNKLGVDVAAVINWLQENGGYCDCEVLANVEPVWQSLRSSRL